MRNRQVPSIINSVSPKFQELIPTFSKLGLRINPICNRGGIKCPHYQESVRHFPMGNARITKTLDFVPLSTRHIPAKPFFKISIFKKNIKRCQKYPKGGPFCEFQIFGVLARNSVFLMA